MGWRMGNNDKHLSMRIETHGLSQRPCSKISNNDKHLSMRIETLRHSASKRYPLGSKNGCDCWLPIVLSWDLGKSLGSQGMEI